MDSSHHKQLTVTGAVITVSSTRKPETDASGKALTDLLAAAEIEVTHYAIVPDDRERIRAEVRAALSRATCVIVTGGTGLTADDVTIEAVAPLLEKTIDGFGGTLPAEELRRDRDGRDPLAGDRRGSSAAVRSSASRDRRRRSPSPQTRSSSPPRSGTS